ncbi:probable leucine-rich repeat receptor-like protein kinase at1g68400 [Phtheirospermum japonicum]|uniref:Probable leucine-rich repeat receptor-like protein kinase at1g68400 n=1 Tax=Phtheirospermum japonicum TaxID=374723 RepID=A0A830CDN9_9LAMI|nr:probable leucine-rich repeat receptor-like protein kinase at1g68400 [Phtheirospermum japonicum]
MAFQFTFPFLLLSTSFFIHSPSTAAADANDTAVLSLFRSQTDLHGTLLANWTAAAAACSARWYGVNCTNDRVTAVALPFQSLRGPIAALSSLDQLRLLDLRGNRLNGSLTQIARCVNLKLVYLSGNDFSGEIPPELAALHRLLRLDLSNNNLRGFIPPQLANLTRLRTLHLQNNDISGPIPNFLPSFPNLTDLNLSNNELYGSIPKSLISRYGETSISGNQGLCGNFPSFPKCSPSTSETVPSSPTSLPPSQTAATQNPPNRHHKKLGNGAIVAIVVANSVLLLVIASFTVAYCCGKNSRDSSSLTTASEIGKRSSYSSEKRVHANNNSNGGGGGGGGGDSDGTNSTDKSKLVFFDRKKQFELEDLLRASAEMLGKGSLGTVYKAVLDDGGTVAVKRLKDANPCARKEFEQYMDVIGKLKHPNVVRFRAYYYAKEEKLLVYDYMPNGSLHSLLHGNRGPGRIPLDWTTRIGLILGAARGLERIHEEYASSRIPHGNVKSSNILLDKNGLACISDFGLSLLLNPVHAVARLGGYRAPEQSEIKRLSQKADVYSFGVLLLEVLTGRAPSDRYSSPVWRRAKEDGDDDVAVDLPKWVQSVVRDEWTAEVFDQELLRYKNIEEELVSTLHVAMACVVPLPEKRPTMAQVVKMIEEIRVDQSPLGEDYDESRNSLSPSLATTDDAF